MAQVEELLEKKPETVSEDMGYGAPSDAYEESSWEQQKLKSWPRQIHVFGVRQNQINQGTAARLRALEIQIQRLEEELLAAKEREKKILGRVAAEMDTMQAEINRLRLSTQLNSNALDRILRQPDPAESETSEEAE